MIEQTPLIVREWIYLVPGEEEIGKVAADITFEVMKKRVSTKKGIACRFTGRFTDGKKVYLNYITEDSYVIDLEEVIDKRELTTMVTNSYSKFEEEFNKRKYTTAFINFSLPPFDAGRYDLDPLLPLMET